MHAGDLLRNRKDYRDGVDRLQTWLKNAEATLSTSQLTTTDKIKSYGEHLRILHDEIEDIEELFKDVSKKFQTLIQELSRDEVDKMMITLKKEKEALVRVRALIPMQLHLYHQILVQQESLEAGQREISSWLDEAESLLDSYILTVDQISAISLLDRHKTFFSRILYYKSLLDSKNKVFNNIVKSMDVNSQQIDSLGNTGLCELNDRFARVSQSAKFWEQKLIEVAQCWTKFHEAERQTSEWLLTAETLSYEKNINNRQSVDYHKKFFNNVDEKIIENLINVACDLKNLLPLEQQRPIMESVDQLQKRWQEVLAFAPLHLMRLDFGLNEATFLQYLKEIENELNIEQQAVVNNEDYQIIFDRNEKFFVKGDKTARAENTLQSLKKISLAYSNLKPDDDCLSRAARNAEDCWKKMIDRMNLLKERLKQVPQQWAVYKQK